jgi:hypothetical protein
MFLSLLMFGILGGISGVVMGTEQINIIIHNTMYVPGHFHGTVVGGTTLAFMAITYPLVNLIFQRELILPKWAQWQPYVFALGVAAALGHDLRRLPVQVRISAGGGRDDGAQRRLRRDRGSRWRHVHRRRRRLAAGG